METALLCCRWILCFGSLTEVCRVEKMFSVSDKLRKPAGSFLHYAVFEDFNDFSKVRV